MIVVVAVRAPLMLVPLSTIVVVTACNSLVLAPLSTIEALTHDHRRIMCSPHARTCAFVTPPIVVCHVAYPRHHLLSILALPPDRRSSPKPGLDPRARVDLQSSLGQRSWAQPDSS